MKRYSVAPTSSRRKSTINASANDDTAAAREELEKLEQETTLVLQEIDKNISRANAVINDRLIPIIKDYSTESKKVWNNAGFWKYFFEQSANVELNSYEDPISNTDVNTIANSRSNLLFNEDEDDEDEDKDEGEAQYGNSGEQQPPNPLDPFKKPLLKPQVDESTPTWSTEQSKKQIQSSTPQFHRKPSLLPGYPNRQVSVYDSNDSIGIQPPPLLTTSLSSSENNNKSPSKPAQSSPLKTQTVRQSLDAYHKLSISPRKARTPNRNALVEDARRRSSVIQNLINSSPTLPEPPILRSELANESEPSSPQKPTDRPNPLSDVERLSPVILPPELSPTKSFQIGTHSKDNTIQRFPTTPKFSERLSGGGKVDIMRTPLGVRLRYDADESDLQPPELQNLDKETRPEDAPEPESDAIRLPGHKRRKSGRDDGTGKRKQGDLLEADDDNDNVFLEPSTKNSPNKSAGSTMYHSIVPGEENTENQSQSRSISQIFADVLNRASDIQSRALQSQGEQEQQQPTQGKTIPSTEIKDIFSDVSGSQLEQSQLDNTENSTSELGSMLRERFNNLTNYGQRPTS